MDDARFQDLLKTIIALALLFVGCYLFHLNSPDARTAAVGAFGVVAGMVAPFAARSSSKGLSTIIPFAPIAFGGAAIAGMLALSGCGATPQLHDNVKIGVGANVGLADGGRVDDVGGNVTLEFDPIANTCAVRDGGAK